ncbi:glycosyl transferase family 2 [bacterium 336/3]|jgi:glycosyltransferase involved in cell wall biosynthesis|nr:glycosyl transferase family 2 [bacterium 336/3]
MQISVVVPAYNEAESLPELTNWIAQVMQQNNFSYEVIVIDDGSTDDTWTVLGQISEKNPAVKGLQFNRNYGKSAALHTGFQQAQGDVVITMDADLQDDPEEIPALYQMITQENFDLVSGWKQKRQDPISKTIPTKLYNAVTRWFSGIPLHDFNCGLKAYKLRVVKSVEVYGEMHRYIPVIAKSVGFKKIGEKKVKHHPRKYGVTKFGWERFLFGFLDLLSITFVTKFRKRPMHFFGGLGVLSFFLGIMITMYVIIEKMIHLYQNERFRNITDQPLFYLALVAIIVGVQLFMAGFLGEMIITNSSKTHEYVVSKKIGI